MRHPVLKRIVLVVASTVAAIAIASYGSEPAAQPPIKPAAAPATAPTRAQAAASAKVLAAAPASAPAAKAAWPEKGKPISLINPYPPGGSIDVSARLLAPVLERELGTPVQVVNKPGAGSQVGVTELVRSKPDGYTIGYTILPTTNALYLDPNRQAVFGRRSFHLLAIHLFEGFAVGVGQDSQYRTLQDLIGAAKAKPGTIKIGVTGIMGPLHLALIQLEKEAGVKFATVHFDGGAPKSTALLGRHIDGMVGSDFDFLSHPEFKALATLGDRPSKYHPGVKTMIDHGYNVYAPVIRGISAPAGLPKGVDDVLGPALKKAIQDPESMGRLDKQFMEVEYRDAADLSRIWDGMDKSLKPIIDDIVRAQQKK